ncbi:MAG: dipeptide epimerase [Victivallales bacterium]|nr:dipeptide epimerase [Victivallales bacterium]
MKKRYPLAISRGVITGSENLFVCVEAFGKTGVGELASTTTEQGENCDTGLAELQPFVESLPDSPSIAQVWSEARERGIRPRALAALDIALWDAFGKACNQPLWRVFGLRRESPATSLTIGINPPEITKERVPEILSRTGAKFLKIKLGSPDGLDADRSHFMAAKEAATPFHAGLRVDANGGWSLENAKIMMKWLAEQGVDYVEQPLVKGAEDLLPELFKNRPLPIFVDESIWYAADVPKLADRVDGVNLKLMKCGGLTEALRIVAVARAHGLGTMIGCMGESSIDISAGASIGALFDHIDLDSHFNLLNDPASGAVMTDGVVLPTDAPGHGASFVKSLE